MELNEIQKQIVETDERHVVVLAAAASGKSEVLVERLRYLINKGADTSKIVCITFTNAAASELKKRIGNIYNMFIGTVHSYCNRLLLMSGVDTSQIIDEENFDELFKLIRKHPEAIRDVEHLLLDEAQDSTEAEFYFMIEMIQPTNYMLVGDTRQVLYSFRRACPQYLFGLIDDWSTTTYDLDTNYRNGSAILDYARRIIAKNGPRYVDYSIAMRPVEGRVIEIENSYSAIADYVEKDGCYNDWFILCRANNEVDNMCKILKERNIPYDTFKRADLDEFEFQEVMARESVKVLTIHASKGLQRKKVAVIGQQYRNADERCISYVAATRAKDLLLWTIPKKQQKQKRAWAAQKQQSKPEPAMIEWG